MHAAKLLSSSLSSRQACVYVCAAYLLFKLISVQGPNIRMTFYGIKMSRSNVHFY